MAAGGARSEEALGPNGQLIVNLIPELELVIGTQPPVPDLPPQDAQNRFQMVFRRFLGVFARPEHPLALFLDDLQWLDAATLDLLEHLITEPEVRHLLLVGRLPRQRGQSRLTRSCGRWRRSARPGARCTRSCWRPSGSTMLADSSPIPCTASGIRARPLAQLVHEKTGGNPFFAIQFLTALAEEGLLAFDADAAAWIWDLARIRAKGYTDNVVDLMVGKLKRLSGTTQEALQATRLSGERAPRSPP